MTGDGSGISWRGHPRRGQGALALALWLTCAVAAPAQEDTRYRLYMHDQPPAAEPDPAPAAPAPARRRGGLRDPFKPGRGHPAARVAYCNDRLHGQIDSCQATFGFASPTYERCEQRAYERFGAGCTVR